MSDREFPCLVFEGPPKMILWPGLTLDVGGHPVRVGGLGRVGDRDPQWFVVEFGPGEGRDHLRETLLDMPVIRMTRQDVVRGNLMGQLQERLQRVLSRKAA